MWALLTGGIVFVLTVVFSLGKASAKREDAAHAHREELLARKKTNVFEQTDHNRTGTESNRDPNSYR